jgi:23S rRNA pseudouridine1911/1915/1917 synthase
MPWITRQTVVESSSSYVGGRVDRLIQELAGGTRAHVAGLFDFDCVSINGQTTHDRWRRVAAGDNVQVRFEKGRRYHSRARPRPHRGFAIVHEDREIIVVDKSADLLTVPTERNEPYTLVYRVNEYVRRSKKGQGACPVHRLDRGVSGLLVLGKTKEIADLIRDQFAGRKPERKYVALVAGRLSKPEGEFRSFLATDKSLNRYSTEDQEIGQYAVTHYRVIERFADTTLVEVRLETGRRNQIRVHFSEAGHAVLGDPRYGIEAGQHPDWPFKRIALHAQTLGLMHPTTEEPLRFESQMPAEMVRFILLARNRSGSDERRLGKQKLHRRHRAQPE